MKRRTGIRQRKTVFLMLLGDFTAMFLILAGILTACYLIFSFQRSKKDYLEYNGMLLKSIESRLDSYFSDLDKASRAVCTNSLLWDTAMGRRKEKSSELEEQLKIVLNNFYYYSSQISSVKLYLPKEGSIYSMDRDVLVNNKLFVGKYDKKKNDGSMDAAAENPGIYQYQVNPEGGINITVALSQPFEDKTAFIFQYTLSDSFWEELIKDLNTEEELVLFFNKNQHFSYCSKVYYRNYMPIIQEKISTDESGSFNINLDERFLVEYSSRDISDWVVAKAIPVSSFYASFKTDMLLYGIFGMLAVGFLACIFASITHRISRPIGVLTKALEGMTPEHFELKANYDKDDEIGVLYRKCHENIEMIQNLIKKEYQLNLSEKEARLKVLQLNPHFIYNVLQLLSNIAVESDNTEIEEITDAFGLLLRYNLANENRKVRVVEEVRALSHYLFIIQKTYGRRLEIAVDTEGKVNNCEMLPLILQPIVENTFKHGLSRKAGQIRIHVRIYAETENLKIVVQDNGIGMGREEVKQIERFRSSENISNDIVGGKGLALIQGRIELEYGRPYGVNVESLFNIGTTVIVTLPLRECEGNGRPFTRERDEEHII